MTAQKTAKTKLVKFALRRQRSARWQTLKILPECRDVNIWKLSISCVGAVGSIVRHREVQADKKEEL